MTTIENLTDETSDTNQTWVEAELAELAALAALDLPDSDGEPMENDRERWQINLGIESLYQHWAERQDFFAGGNMFVYYSLSQAETIMEELETPSQPKQAFRGPDMFIVLNVDGRYRRQKWVVWLEEGRYPNVIFEFLSPKTRRVDLEEKKKLYEQTFGTREYFCFDYLNPEAENSLMGWRLDAHGRYQPIQADERGWLWSEMLELWVGRWSGTLLRDETTWLRFYTPEGELVLTPAEAERQRAEAAEAELARLKAQLAERGIDLSE